MTEYINALAPARRDRFIKLGDQQDMLTVLPAEAAGEPNPAFTPFQLPALALSYEAWLLGLLETMNEYHHRAMATVLTLDCHRHRWGPPLMPRQQCRADGVAWLLSEQDFDTLPPQMRIAGSVQSGVLADDDEIISRLPPFDGIHLYLGLCPVPPGFRRWFFRMSGEVKPAPAMSVMYDDWRQLLTLAASRLHRSEA